MSELTELSGNEPYQHVCNNQDQPDRSNALTGYRYQTWLGRCRLPLLDTTRAVQATVPPTSGDGTG